MMRWTLDRAEDVYYSKCREPLGRGWVRGHQLPPGAGETYAFGARLTKTESEANTSARDAIAPVDVPYDVRALDDEFGKGVPHASAGLQSATSSIGICLTTLRDALRSTWGLLTHEQCHFTIAVSLGCHALVALWIAVAVFNPQTLPTEAVTCMPPSSHPYDLLKEDEGSARQQ
jgi:hypothetical protein